MIRILFVCHGNICRSTMAQCIMQKLVDDEGMHDDFKIDSAATSKEEIGNRIYPPALRELNARSIPYIEHRARQIRSDEYDDWDHIIVMDENNLRNIHRIIKDKDHKVIKLNCNDIADPWYSGDFETTFEELYTGCTRLLDRCKSFHREKNE